MSALTSNEVRGLMEAYQAVYAPQELTEEQVWEEVEIWVNDLLEEGYDLSDYTWEEMYESYIEEQDKATNMATWAKANPKLAAAAAERERTRGTSATTNPLIKDLKSRLPAPKPASAPSAAPKPASAPSAAPKPASAPSAAPKPASASKPPAASTAPAASPPPAASTAPPKTPMTAFQAAGGQAQLNKLNKGLSPRSGLRATQSTIERQGRENLYKAGGGDAALAMSAKPRNVRGGGQVKVPTLSRSDIEKRGASAATLKQSYEYDAYDLVLEYLLSQGHADTLEEANYVMLEMDAEMIQNIVETRRDPRGRPASGPMNVYGKSKPNTDPSFQAALTAYREKQKKKSPEEKKKELDAYIERQRNR